MSKFLCLTGLTLIICSSLQAQKVEHFKYSPCGGSKDSLQLGSERIINRIIYQEYVDNMLKIGFGALSNCAGMSNPNSSFNSDTLKISFDEFIPKIDTMEDGSIVTTSEWLACDCYFESEYVISDLPKKPSTILLNGEEVKYHPDKYRTYPITFELLDRDTINYTDKYGFEQGLWINRNSKGQLLFKGIKKDDSVVEGTSYRYHVAKVHMSNCI